MRPNKSLALPLSMALLASLGITACSGSSSSKTSSNSIQSSSSTSSAASSTSSSVSSSSVSTSTSSQSSSASSDSNLTDCVYDALPVILMSQTTTIEAEYYDQCPDSFADQTPGNSGGALRQDDVDIKAESTLADALVVDDFETGEYLEFTVNIEEAGHYQFNAQAQNLSNLNVEFELSQLNSGIEATKLSLAADENWQSLSAPEAVYLSEGLSILRLEVTSGSLALNQFSLSYSDIKSPSPAAAVSAMGMGINLGNTLDAYPNEGDWAPAAQAYYFEDFKAAGFNHVRIPVTWDTHVSDTSPYSIDATYLDRVEQVVDWALAEDLYVILNAHHEIWLKENYSNSGYRQRFDAIWRQVAERFQHKPGRLMFEILNEPVGMTAAQVDDLNPRILAIMREHNPTRVVVFSGNSYTPIDALLDAEIPEDDYLAGNFHSYDPWGFAGQCAQSWGSSADRAAMESIYQRAATWSQSHNIPVMVNEFGAAHYDYTTPENVCDVDQRLDYLEQAAEFARQYGVAATYWDDAGSFGSYNRSERSWDPSKDAIMGTSN